MSGHGLGNSLKSGPQMAGLQFGFVHFTETGVTGKDIHQSMEGDAGLAQKGGASQRGRRA